MFKLTETEWRTKFTLYFKEIRKLNLQCHFTQNVEKQKALFPLGLQEGPVGCY
jgi:hypothetical protein